MLSGHFPFKIGTTSFIRPATILENVRYLAPLVDDIELLCFESDAIAAYPSINEVGELKQIAEDQSLSYTVHLPVDIDLGAKENFIRIESIDKLKRCIERMEFLKPFGYNLHLQKSCWDGHFENTIESLRQLGSFIDPRKLCIENTDFDHSAYLPILGKLNFSTCCDVGHYKLASLEYKELLRTSRVIHLHGIEMGRDHRSLEALGRYELTSILSTLHNRIDDFVLTIEVFSEAKLKSSLNYLESIYE